MDRSNIRDYHVGNCDVKTISSMGVSDPSKVLIVKGKTKKEYDVNLDSSIKHLYLSTESFSGGEVNG